MGRATIARSVRAPTRGDVRGLSRNGAGSSAKPSSRSVVSGAAPGVPWSKVHEPAGRWPLAMAKARVKASICSVARVHAWTQSSNRSAVRNSSKASNAAARCRALSASGGGGHSRTVAAAWATRSLRPRSQLSDRRRRRSALVSAWLLSKRITYGRLELRSLSQIYSIHRPRRRTAT